MTWQPQAAPGARQALLTELTTLLDGVFELRVYPPPSQGDALGSTRIHLLELDESRHVALCGRYVYNASDSDWLVTIEHWPEIVCKICKALALRRLGPNPPRRGLLSRASC